jgi:hypothetical protein
MDSEDGGGVRTGLRGTAPHFEQGETAVAAIERTAECDGEPSTGDACDRMRVEFVQVSVASTWAGVGHATALGQLQAELSDSQTDVGVTREAVATPRYRARPVFQPSPDPLQVDAVYEFYGLKWHLRHPRDMTEEKVWSFIVGGTGAVQKADGTFEEKERRYEFYRVFNIPSGWTWRNSAAYRYKEFARYDPEWSSMTGQRKLHSSDRIRIRDIRPDETCLPLNSESAAFLGWDIDAGSDSNSDGNGDSDAVHSGSDSDEAAAAARRASQRKHMKKLYMRHQRAARKRARDEAQAVIDDAQPMILNAVLSGNESDMNKIGSILRHHARLAGVAGLPTFRHGKGRSGAIMEAMREQSTVPRIEHEAVRPKFMKRLVRRADGQVSAVTPHHTVTITGIGHEAPTTHMLIELLRTYMLPPSAGYHFIEADVMMTPSRRRGYSVARVPFESPDTARASAERIRAIVSQWNTQAAMASTTITHTPGGASQSAVAASSSASAAGVEVGAFALQWRVSEARVPMQKELIVVNGVDVVADLVKDFEAKPSELASNLLRPDVLPPNHAYLLRAICWIDGRRKQTFMKLTLLDQRGLVIGGERLSDVCTLVAFIGKENVMKNYFHHYMAQLLAIQARVFEFSPRDASGQPLFVKPVPLRVRVDILQCDHHAANITLGGLGGGSPDRDYVNKGSIMRMAGRILCPGVPDFKVISFATRYQKQNEHAVLVADAVKAKGRKRVKELVDALNAAKWQRTLFEMVNGRMKSEPFLASSDVIAQQMIVCPPQFHNLCAINIKVQHVILEHLKGIMLQIAGDGYNAYRQVFENMEESAAHGVIAASAGTIRRALADLAVAVYKPLREYRGDPFQAGFGVLLPCQQFVQMHYYRSARNSIYRRLDHKVSAHLVLMELLFAAQFYAGNMRRKTPKQESRKAGEAESAVTARHYKVPTQSLYAADFGHNTVEFEAQHLLDDEVTLFHLLEERGERSLDYARSAEAGTRNQYDIAAAVNIEHTTRHMRREVPMSRSVRSGFAVNQLPPWNTNYLAVCRCWSTLSVETSFNWRRLLTQLFRTEAYNHLIFFGAKDHVLIQRSAGPTVAEGERADAFWIDLVRLAGEPGRRSRAHPWLRWRAEARARHPKWEYCSQAVHYFSFWRNEAPIDPRRPASSARPADAFAPPRAFVLPDHDTKLCSCERCACSCVDCTREREANNSEAVPDAMAFDSAPSQPSAAFVSAARNSLQNPAIREVSIIPVCHCRPRQACEVLATETVTPRIDIHPDFRLRSMLCTNAVPRRMAYPPLQETIHVTDLTIYHWAALVNVRRIAAIRSLKLCYRALLRAVLTRVANDPSAGLRQQNATKRLEESDMGSVFLKEIEDEKGMALRRWTAKLQLGDQQLSERIGARKDLYCRLVRARWLFLTGGNPSPLDSDPDQKFAPELVAYDDDIKVIMADSSDDQVAGSASAPDYNSRSRAEAPLRDRSITRGETWLRVCELTRLIRCWRHWKRLADLLAVPDGITRLRGLATELPFWLEQEMRNARKRRGKKDAAEKINERTSKTKKSKRRDDDASENEAVEEDGAEAKSAEEKRARRNKSRKRREEDEGPEPI